MFFSLDPVQEHPVYRIHEALETFLRNAVMENVFREELFPEWFRPIMAQSRTMRVKFDETFNSLQNITEVEREEVLQVFINNNEIERLCADTSYGIAVLGDNLGNILGNLKEVCEHLYNHTLKSAAFREEGIENGLMDHYIRFRNLNSLVCPFCGIENYPDRESGMRASYDHYLNRARYPFSGVNFRNLVPMCRSCNEPPNKGMKDILNRRGRRRQVFYPYTNNSGMRLRIVCAKKPEIDNNEGEWSIEITPSEAADAEKVETWNEVFSLAGRLRARIKEKNNIWVRDFLAAQFYGNAECDVGTLRTAFANYSESLSDLQLIKLQNESVLKQSFFEFLSEEAEDTILEGYVYHCKSNYIFQTAKRGEFLSV